MKEILQLKELAASRLQETSNHLTAALNKLNQAQIALEPPQVEVPKSRLDQLFAQSHSIPSSSPRISL